MNSSPQPDGPETFAFNEIVHGSRAVYVRLRQAGQHRNSAWLIGDATKTELSEWISAASSQADATLELTQVEADTRPQPVSRRHISDHQRGLWAFSDEPSNPNRWLAPNDVISGNRNHPKALQKYFGNSTDQDQSLSAFATRQWLYRPGAGNSWVLLDRQKLPMGARAVDRKGLEQFRDGLADWLYSQADQDGGLPYKYWPGNGRYSPADNSIRRFFGAFAMRQYAWQRGDGSQRRIAERCLTQLLDQRCRLNDGYGLILDRQGIKLGAVAVAGLTLLAGPVRSPELLTALYRTTRRLTTHDGGFKTFWWPHDRNENHNFYPGEALLFWAHLYRQTLDPVLRRQIDQGLQRYQRWHRDQPNPAFVPWHTLALARMYETTGNPGYLADIASMNRWLLPFQQWLDAPHNDLRGRFYDPNQPTFGPPHASSTAVYCESLCAAAKVLFDAGVYGDSRRFVQAALRGLTQLRHLQYLDTTDLFRFTHPARVRGALRTEAYDLTVRVDSVAHALQACLACETIGWNELQRSQSPLNSGRPQP